jgi:hypothetical protein
MWSDCVKRRALKLVVFLLLGAIINVAFAWGCVNWHGQLTYSRTTNAKSQWDWLFARGLNETPRADFIQYDFHIASLDQRGATIQTYVASEIVKEGFFGSFVTSDFHAAQIVRAGWPVKSLTGQSVDQAKSIGGPAASVGEIPFVLRPSNCGVFVMPMFTIGTINFGGRYTPILPIFPGFAINTIFYAAILWMIFVMPFAIRRRRRIKRGLCARCAYPVGVSNTCTECGAEVARH